MNVYKAIVEFFVWQPAHFWAVAAVFGAVFFVAIIVKKRYHPQLRALPMLIVSIMWLIMGYLEWRAKIQGANIRIDILLIWPFFFSVTAVLITFFILSLIRAVREIRKDRISQKNPIIRRLR